MSARGEGEVERVRAATLRWIERVVIGLDLCPFAAEVVRAGRLHIAVCGESEPARVLAALDAELAALLRAEVAKLETTLLVLPRALPGFEEFNDFLDLADALLEERGCTGVVQIASFHPRYRFAGASDDDAANYSNRSPYPMLHLLREESIARATAAHADPRGIPARNVELLRRLGLAAVRDRLAACEAERRQVSPAPLALLVRPDESHLDGYIAALRRGWSPDNVRGAEAAREELAEIERDAAAFLASLEDREAKRPAIELPDGSRVDRLPSFKRFIWDGEFCGSIQLRWKPGTTDLPPTCLGHIGYAVVPWRQRRGLATRALALLLPEAWSVGLAFVELTTDSDSVASRRVIERNGGVLVEHFTKPASLGGGPGLRYRIHRPHPQEETTW